MARKAMLASKDIVQDWFAFQKSQQLLVEISANC
jgi:hypothetical protein